MVGARGEETGTPLVYNNKRIGEEGSTVNELHTSSFSLYVFISFMYQSFACLMGLAWVLEGRNGMRLERLCTVRIYP